MNALIGYKIPIKGLKYGNHQFLYKVDDEFFNNFEDSLIRNAALNVALNLERKPNLIVLDFEFDGTINQQCDRCTEDFDMPLGGSNQILVKYSDEEQEEKVDVIYISPDTSNLDISQIVYELIHLNIPLRKACLEDENNIPSCGNTSISKYFAQEEIDVEDETTNSVWDVLKDLKTD